MSGDQALVEVVRVGASPQFLLPLGDRALVVSRLRQHDGVDHVGDGGVGHVEWGFALFAVDSALSVELVRVCVDASRLADGKLGDLLRWLAISSGILQRIKPPISIFSGKSELRSTRAVISG